MNYIKIFTNKNNGFTLVELAIVLIIIGLITGGVVGAQSLIESGNISKAISQIEKYKRATLAFNLEYDGLPGDFREAEDYGLHQSGSSTNACPANGTSDYNGNGDKILDTNSAAGYVMYSGEMFNFFVHLNNSSLIETGISRNTGSPYCRATHTAGMHYPELQVGKSLLAVTDYYTKKLYFIIGGFGSTHAEHMYHVTEEHSYNVAHNNLTAKQAKKIDQKIDDSLPDQGRIKVITAYRSITDLTSGYLSFDSTDSSTNCIYNSSYNVSLNENSCTIAVEIGKI